MHSIEAKSILSQSNAMNIYRGCLHGCIYCDSRSKCYNINHDFEDIQVKINAPELLEKALKSKRQKCMIRTGSMSDPYIPLEKELKLTRKCLEIINTYEFGVTILTKSTLVLRDLDILKKINKHSKVIVQFTLTTYDEDLCKILEPNVSSTYERFQALKTLNEAGIETMVWMDPILPFINDTEENIRGILEYCLAAKVKGIVTFGIGMSLRYGSREYYYQHLDKHFEGVKYQYMKHYPNSYILTPPNSSKLNNILRYTCKKHGILINQRDVLKYLDTYEAKVQQIPLF